MTAEVERIEYDPNRSSHIALILYKDGERRYIIAPKGLKEGDKVSTGNNKTQNCHDCEIGKLAFEEGCQKCYSCGYSKC